MLTPYKTVNLASSGSSALEMGVTRSPQETTCHKHVIQIQKSGGIKKRWWKKINRETTEDRNLLWKHPLVVSNLIHLKWMKMEMCYCFFLCQWIPLLRTTHQLQKTKIKKKIQLTDSGYKYVWWVKIISLVKSHVIWFKLVKFRVCKLDRLNTNNKIKTGQIYVFSMFKKSKCLRPIIILSIHHRAVVGRSMEVT